MGALTEAIERLSHAVEHLERAAAAHLPQCRADRRELAEALAAAQAEARQLETLTEAVAGRLEGTIGRIHARLGPEAADS